MKTNRGHWLQNMERNIGTCLFQTGVSVRKNQCLKNMNKQMNNLAKHIVHSGINKNLSNEAIFDTYDVSIKGMENQYLFNLQCLNMMVNLRMCQVFYNHFKKRHHL